MGAEFLCSPYKDGLSEISSLILAGMTESGKPTVRGMTGIYTVSGEKSLCLLLLK